MAHQRNRFCEQVIAKALKQAPCVGVVGMRQVGKTTLLKKIAVRYHSFDQIEFQTRFERQGASLLEVADYPLALDEIQKYPPAFDALKYSIDNLRRLGRFLISGSVRFAARRQIRESLTGRLFLLELFPLNLSECHSKKPSEFLSLVTGCHKDILINSLQKKTWANQTQLYHFMKSGGLPGICFLRDDGLRENYFANHLDTLLGRDIQLVRQVRLSVTKLITILTELAKNQGFPACMADLSRRVGCSQPTVKAVLDALEGLFLIRPFGKTYFFEDPGLSHYLCPLEAKLTRQDMIRCLYHEFRTQIAYGSFGRVMMESYTTRGGSEIPFMLSFRSGHKLAIAVEAEETPSDKALKSLTWFKKKESKTKSIVLCIAKKPFVTTSGLLCLPWHWVF